MEVQNGYELCLTGLASFFHFKARLTLTEWFRTQTDIWQNVRQICTDEKKNGFSVNKTTYCLRTYARLCSHSSKHAYQQNCVCMPKENISHNTTFLNGSHSISGWKPLHFSSQIIQSQSKQFHFKITHILEQVKLLWQFNKGRLQDSNLNTQAVKWGHCLVGHLPGV